MSEKEDNIDDNESDEDTNEKRPSSSVKLLENASKKANRTLRFVLPEPDSSDHSIASSISFNGAIGREEKQISIFKKYISPPLRHNQPRGALIMPCFMDNNFDREDVKLQNATFMVSATSSQQLFEIAKTSPTPSDEDLNLLNATYMRNLDKMREAVERGASVNSIRERQCPLMVATDMADERLVSYLLSVPGVNTNIQNVYGLTPLAVAVKNASDKIVYMLLNQKADVNLADNMGRTPLHEALFQQRPQMVKLLLNFGANFDQSDVFGERPMYTASVKKPHIDCLYLLLSFGATPEYANIFGMTLLSRAIVNFTDFDIIKMLVRNGASVNSVDLNTGKAPLHYSALVNDIRITEFLLSEGANANIKTFYGFTPFDEAIFHKSFTVAECLFELTENASLKKLNSIRNNSFLFKGNETENPTFILEQIE